MQPITVFYYVLTAYIAMLAIWNFAKSKNLQESAMYAIITVPLLLRVLRIK